MKRYRIDVNDYRDKNLIARFVYAANAQHAAEKAKRWFSRNQFTVSVDE